MQPLLAAIWVSFTELNILNIQYLTKMPGTNQIMSSSTALLNPEGHSLLIAQVASKLNEAFDTLLDAYERIGSALPIIQAIDNLFYSQPHVQQVLANVFEDILTFHKRAIVFFNNKSK